MTRLPDQRLYIDGRHVEAKSGRKFETLNPATNEAICRVHEAGPDDVEDAVAAARKGAAVWSRMSGIERQRILLEAVRLLRARNDELAALEVADTGKPISEARSVDIVTGADVIEYYAGVAAKLHGDHYDLPPSAFAYTRREPLGICAGIGAWNYPIQIACWKSAPALACGNAMIFKPAELTPLTALKLAELYSEAGLPDGVFNVVQGPASTGQLLTRHRGIAKVSLTGEVSTGKRVMADAATTLKHVTLELGGKSPLILFDDCDLEFAVSTALLANFFTQGEICSNGTRVFVQRGIREAFVEQLIPRVKAMRVGDPMDPQTQVGALISREHLQKVLGYIEEGRRSNAVLVAGGERPSDPRLANGNFVAPAVFDGCTDDMRIVREEIFGPVMAVLSFDDEDEVVARANDTDYGLSAGIFTTDLARAHRVAARIEAGVVWINTYNMTPPEVPFGGYKQSGLGRENGLATIEHYTQLKTVYVETGRVAPVY